MSAWNEMLSGIVGAAGTQGMEELEEALGDLRKSVDSPTKKAVLNLALDAISRYGVKGLGMVQDLVEGLGKDDVPNLSFASLRARSDYLAALQNAEADEKSAARDFLALLGDKLAIILKAFIAGLVG